MAFSKLSRTLERTKLVSFSEPYVTLKEGLLINRVSLANLTTRSMNEVEIIRNLQGKIGVIKGSSYVDFAKRRFPRADVVELESWEKVIDATIQGNVVAAYRDEFAIKKTVLSNPELSLSLQTVVILDTKDNISVALPWDSLHLAEFVSQAFETLNIQYSADTLLNGDFEFN
ncbi:ABC transporter substrate-binding protein [Picosynechococcus sp. NKBG15041c]|uniref:substrate-binding periplasmic protein n=1 Tax=Picosynechococcus sp. NKBG15041c TaxID=1407650 RepID=UPI000685C2A0|nr:transporter substrate-binding domain-containing protein [Picosynechococcus sp. NKBG15041c]